MRKREKNARKMEIAPTIDGGDAVNDYRVTVYAADANGNAHYTTEAVKVALTTSSASVFTLDSASVTIPAGAYYNNQAHWIPGSNGGTNAQLGALDCTGVASGCPPSTRSALYAYASSSLNLSVVTPSLSFSWGTLSLGLGQYFDAYPNDCCTYIQSPDYQAANVTVTLGHVGAAKTSVPSSVVIPQSSYYAYFRITAAAKGTDTLTASAATPFHNPATAYVVIDSGRIDTFSGWPANFTAVGDSVLVTLYTRDPGQGVRRVSAATTFNIALTNMQVHIGGANVTSVTVPADAGGPGGAEDVAVAGAVTGGEVSDRIGAGFDHRGHLGPLGPAHRAGHGEHLHLARLVGRFSDEHRAHLVIDASAHHLVQGLLRALEGHVQHVDVPQALDGLALDVLRAALAGGAVGELARLRACQGHEFAHRVHRQILARQQHRHGAEHLADRGQVLQ